MQTITITGKAALLLGMGFIASMVLVAGGAAWASHQFSDVPDDHTFHDSIGYVASAGIANGFADGTYRPGTDVTRGQMAAFIHRASGNAPGIAPSVNAAKLDGELGSSIRSRIADLESKLAAVTYNAETKVLRISGANLQVVSGSGSTSGTVNGLGNLIVGYNEGFPPRTGSHNLVLGSGNSYSSYGGIVAGQNNTISGAFASVTGGAGNGASGNGASITGGVSNDAGGVYATVTGGFDNTASGDRASVTGGGTNTASGDRASVTGGQSNTASGFAASITGGELGVASGQISSITAGWTNRANYFYSSVSGGSENVAGCNAQNVCGVLVTVTGGTMNTAIGSHSSISGGQSNIASGEYASVTGGQGNSGAGHWSTVGGGKNRSAAGAWDWAAGSLSEEE